jgi:hypothetical protein
MGAITYVIARYIEHIHTDFVDLPNGPTKLDIVVINKYDDILYDDGVATEKNYLRLEVSYPAMNLRAIHR